MMMMKIEIEGISEERWNKILETVEETRRVLAERDKTQKMRWEALQNKILEGEGYLVTPERKCDFTKEIDFKCSKHMKRMVVLSMEQIFKDGEKTIPAIKWLLHCPKCMKELTPQLMEDDPTRTPERLAKIKTAEAVLVPSKVGQLESNDWYVGACKDE